MGRERPLYADADYYGEITHPTSQLVDLLAKIAVRLGGATDYHMAPCVTRLNQGMGGGKSHACIGAYHLAANGQAVAATDLGQEILTSAQRIVGRSLPNDLGQPHVVVLP